MAVNERKASPKWEAVRERLGLVDVFDRAMPRRWVATHLGLGLKTVERYELHGLAPEWYLLALLGLALKLGKKPKP
ncbi:MAG: hypothetical protein ACREMV_15075 [Gemmatimonadales bacterium]